MSFIFNKLFYKCCLLKALPDRVQQPDVVPRLVRPLVGIPEHAAIESKARRIHMEPSRPAVPLVRVPSNHSAIVTDRPFQLRLALPHAQHCDRPGAKTPYASKLLEEVKGVDVVLVGEVDESVDAVLLDVVEPEQRLRDKAERVREAVQVVRLQRAGAGRRHDYQGRRLQVCLRRRRWDTD